MKSGTYKVSFEIKLTNCLTLESAEQTVASLLAEALENDQIPEVSFELIDGIDLDYTLEDPIDELDFEEAV